ncbi:MAG: TGS domain-containing protein, partial [Chloroflexi bacterium]|nr:TGS domain-containing protein [Chloroflexota bacterium]
MPAQPESVTLAFPDGAKRTYACPVTGHDVAAAISPGLAKAALAVRLDGDLRDLTRPITADGAIEIVT